MRTSYYQALDPSQLRALRLELFTDLSRMEFAERAGVSDPTVARAERGELIRGISAGRIARLLSRPLRQLFREQVEVEEGVPA